MRVALGLVCLLTFASTAEAQTSGYISGAVFADVKQFAHFESSARDDFYNSTDNSAITGGGAVRVGGWLHPNVTLEIGVDASAKTTVDAVDTPGAGLVFAGGVSSPDFDLKASTQFTTVTVAIGFHPATDRRVRFGYLAGYALVRGTEKSDYTEQEVSPTFGRLPGYFKATRTFNQNAGAVMMGAEAAVTMTNSLALAPEVRVLIFGGTFLIRPGVSVRWNL